MSSGACSNQWGEYCHIFNLLQAQAGHATFLNDVVPGDWASARPSDMWIKRTVVVTSCRIDILAKIHIGSHALACRKRKEEAGRMCTDGWNSACLPTSSVIASRITMFYSPIFCTTSKFFLIYLTIACSWISIAQFILRFLKSFIALSHVSAIGIHAWEYPSIPLYL